MGIVFCKRLQSLIQNDNSYRDCLLKQLINIAEANNGHLPKKFYLVGIGISTIYETFDELEYTLESILASNGSNSSIREITVRRK